MARSKRWSRPANPLFEPARSRSDGSERDQHVHRKGVAPDQGAPKRARIADAIDAADLTRLKVDIHRLKGDRDRIFTVMGEKLWEMRDSEKMKDLLSSFEADFNKLQALIDEIKEKEKAASKISL